MRPSSPPLPSPVRRSPLIISPPLGAAASLVITPPSPLALPAEPERPMSAAYHPAEPDVSRSAGYHPSEPQPQPPLSDNAFLLQLQRQAHKQALVIHQAARGDTLRRTLYPSLTLPLPYPYP